MAGDQRVRLLRRSHIYLEESGIHLRLHLITLSTPASIRNSAKLYKIYTMRGGAEGNRTPDLCSAIAALSHLSYSPLPAVYAR